MMTLIEILSLNSLPFKKILTESTGPGKTIKLLDSSEVEKELSLSDSLIQLNFLMSDSLHKDFPLRKKITLYIKNYSANNIGFFEKYPDFGLWILFTCATVSVWFILSVINSLDISKLYKESFNQNFLNYDIIYLFGGLYSLLILFFYLPLRLTFSQVKEKYPEANNQDEKQETTKKSAFYNDKDFLNRLKETFTVSTPLLAALIQLIIDVLSNT